MVQLYDPVDDEVVGNLEPGHFAPDDPKVGLFLLAGNGGLVFGL
jgi:hypothetical protein